MRIALRPAAELDISEAIDWYDAQQQGLGDQFLSRVDAAFRRIAQRPSGYPLTHRSFQRAVLGKFPYTIYFRKEGDSVVIFAVYHQRRRPADLTKRLEEN